MGSIFNNDSYSPDYAYLAFVFLSFPYLFLSLPHTHIYIYIYIYVYESLLNETMYIYIQWYFIFGKPSWITYSPEAFVH